MAKRASKTRLAKELGVSRSGLYYRAKRPKQDEELRVKIEAMMREHPGYGQRRIAAALKINRKRVKRVMNKNHLKPARRAKAPAKPNDYGRAALDYADITALVCPIAPDFIWLSDFSFIPFQGSFVYLATVMDRFSAEVLGVSIMTSHRAELVQTAILAALKTGRTPVWFHSDQGSEYTSNETLCLLKSRKIQISMSPKSSPWRNGAQESFFGRFKVEFGDPGRFDSLALLIEAIHRYIAYYNHARIHTRLAMPPLCFKQLWDEQHLLNKQSTTFSQVMSLPPHPPRAATSNSSVKLEHSATAFFSTTSFYDFKNEELVSKVWGP